MLNSSRSGQSEVTFEVPVGLPPTRKLAISRPTSGLATIQASSATMVTSDWSGEKMKRFLLPLMLMPLSCLAWSAPKPQASVAPAAVVPREMI